MSVSGICSYCDTPAHATCKMCGKAICPQHTGGGGEACVPCTRGTTM